MERGTVELWAKRERGRLGVKRRPTYLMLAAGLLGVAAAVIARQPLMELLQGPPAAAPPTIPVQATAPPPPELIAKPHLAWAEEECERVVEEHVKSLDDFFVAAKKNTRGFADEALSWGSKWRLVADHVPFASGGKHEQFMRGKFEDYVFKPAQLEDAVKKVVANYLKHVESIENQMLVKIRADVEEFPSAYLIGQMDEGKVRATYDEALARAIDSTGSSLRADVATEIVSIITGEVLTQVAVRLGVSTAVLGTGAASSWATFGVGLVVGLIVDQIVSRVWDWYADPRGNLTTQLNVKLDEIHRLIVEGSSEAPGLRDRLRQFAGERSGVRSRAVRSILQPL